MTITQQLKAKLQWVQTTQMSKEPQWNFVRNALHSDKWLRKTHPLNRHRVEAAREQFLEEQRQKDLAQRRGKDPDRLKRAQLRKEQGKLTYGEMVLMQGNPQVVRDVGLGESPDEEQT